MRASYNDKVNNSFDSLSLSNDGTLVIMSSGSGWAYIMQVSEVEVTDIYNGSFKIECNQIDKDGPSQVTLGGTLYFKTKCILTDVKTGPIQGPKSSIISF
jgi:hypothetical protein